MFINRIAKQLMTSKEFFDIVQKLDRGQDTTFAIAQSARPVMLASIWAQNPRPTLYIVSGEEAADRTANTLASWLGMDYIYRYPERKDLPWQDKQADPSVIGARLRAIEALNSSKPCIVVASARALMRRVPPSNVAYFKSTIFEVGEEIEFEKVPDYLVNAGYIQDDMASMPGTFYVHGDAIDIFPTGATSPVRIEFFGDEIDRIRKVVSATGQTIGDLDKVEICAASEISFTEKTIDLARHNLYNKAQEDSAIAADLEKIEEKSLDPTLDKYLLALYGKSANPIEHIAKDCLVVLAEPRALFDDCLRSYEEISAKANEARVNLDGLYTAPVAMDFGRQQQLSFSSILRSGSKADASMQIRQPNIAGGNTKLLGRVRQLLLDGNKVVFAIPDRAAREHMEADFLSEYITFSESLAHDPENKVPLLDRGANDKLKPIPSDQVVFFDLPVPAGTIIPGAKLAILSVSDLTSRMAKHGKTKRIDPTDITFPFKPGDYVVHSTHGIAHFIDIVRQEVSGKERDYFLLEYANEDKLYVPLEQVDRITRYIGPDSKNPRLTRLNTADWTRATTKARKSAKKLAFDLVDLYTRRSTVQGHAFIVDTAEQEEMESSFAYELTHDQASAIADIKADMESRKPMDRLLCGDVGFGKTEVALRAAFKCVTDGKQVMVLCPTTILAEQHYETFFERFAQFDKEVASLSRFVTAGKQKKILKEFSEGKVDVLIGTHRLLSSDVNPFNLGLVIIDEEQRFGVGHKEQLKNMREQIDVLTLSATPIPRTMQMAMSGVRDMSLIMTPPPGRRAVKVQVGEYDPDVVAAAIRRELAREGQVYYVSNRVNTIEDAKERVEEVVPEARVGVAHGQMSARETEDIMLAFEKREIDVLVATTIIESGIDNPHTNTLIIEDAQRLGLAQLYQLKGRVGRGYTQAYAYFMFPEEIPLTTEATDRLLAIDEFQELGSGMRIAMRDLEIRGAGSLMGAEQHGNLSSVGFDLFTQMLSQAVAEARGEIDDAEVEEVNINLPCDFYLSDEYLPQIDKRVLVYRKLAVATQLSYIDNLEREVEKEYGALPSAGRNLFDRARLRIRAARLGVTSISLVDNRRIVFMGLEVPRELKAKFKQKKAIIYPKSKKLAYPFYAQNDDVVMSALAVLEMIGADDEVEEI